MALAVGQAVPVGALDPRVDQLPGPRYMPAATLSVDVKLA